MKLPLLALAAGLAAHSAAAQTTLGPWVEITNSPTGGGFQTSFTSDLRLPPDGSLWNMLVGNSGRGYQSAVLMSTPTNGRTWRGFLFNAKTLSSSGVPASGQLPGSFAAVDSLRAWTFVTDYTANSVKLWRTTTGPFGLAVAPTQPPRTGALYFFDANTGLIVSSSLASGATFCRTTDGGQSWQPAASLPVATGSTLVGGCMLGNTAWLSFTNGALLRSTDAGLTWMAFTPPVPLAAPSFRDAQHGLALGYVDPYTSNPTTSTLYRTVDGGATWALVTLAGPVQWGRPAAVPGSAGTFLAVGRPAASYGGFSTFRSSDDGLTWQGLGSTRPLRSMAAGGPDNIWAITENESGPVPSYFGGNLLRYSGTALATGGAQPALATTVYPNPTTGRVQLPAAGPHQHATLYDATGRQCRTLLLGPAESTLDLSSLGAGHYLLRLTGGTSAPQQQHLVVAP